MKFRQLRDTFAAANWPMILLYAAIFALLGGALFWQLGTLLPGYATSELASYHASLNVRGLLENPINAPFLLLVKAFTYIFKDNLVAGRFVSAGIGTFVLGIFAILLRRWHGKWTAVIGTVLFGLSAWFLHVSRLGTPEVLLFGVFLLTAAGYWLRRTNSPWALLCCFVLAATALYTPGLIWFVVLGLLWQWKTIDAVFKKHLFVVTLGALLLFASLIPLGWAVYHNQALIMPLLGLPDQWPAPLTMLENLLKVPFHLFIRSEANPVGWLGTAPLLDVFSLTMFVLGGYLYLKKIRLLRTPLFLSILILTAVLIAVDSSITFTVIIPFMYIVIASGVSYLIDLWMNTFPRNPIARAVGWGAVTTVVVLACSFQLTHYFIGWPHAQATRDTFTVQQP